LRSCDVIEARSRKRDGRTVYDVRLRDPNGKEYSRTFLTKREAQAFEASERTDRNRGTGWIDPRSATTPLDALAGRWLVANPAKRPRTMERDRQILAAAVAALGPSRAVGSVTRAGVQGLVDAWRSRLAASTVRRMYSTVRALFNYAEAAEVIGRSPCLHIRLPAAELVDRPSLDASQLAAVASGPVTMPRWCGSARCSDCGGGGCGPDGGQRRLPARRYRRDRPAGA
jgi:hypothetical protein